MPVPTIGKVSVISHEAIGAPCHNVGLAHGNVEPTARAQVKLLSGNSRDVLHVPRSAALVDRAPKCGGDAIKVERGIWLSGTPTTAMSIGSRTIAAGHGF